MDNAIEMDYENNNQDTWMIEKDGRYATGIKNYLLGDGIPEEGADKILDNAAKVLGYCPNPEEDIEKKSTGIVIGKVQSGKTSNFIALTALAFDNGYTHVIVFGGTKNLLVSQNSERIKEYFDGMNDVKVLNTTDHKEQLDENTINKFIKNGKKVIIVALKTRKQIDFIKDNIFSGYIMSERPTLIIDDEGDEASLNTLVKKGKKSSTYRAIENLKNAIKIHCFVSVTATPQANLLIDSMDVLSPEFGVLVDPGNGYCGLDAFHQPGSKYIREIPEEESSLLEDGVPESFYEALAMFFVACGIFEMRGKADDAKFSMLIHPSQLKIDHKIVYNKVKAIISHWAMLSENRDDIAYSELQRRLKKAYEQYEHDGVNNLPDFSNVENAAIKAIGFNGLHTVNGDSVPNGADDLYDFNIYVGGAMLGRGLTLKGLAITYIIRTTKGVSNADTVTQRARWFGYKTKYLDLCRVYAVKKIIKDFQDIREHENDLWETVKTANLQGTRFKDIARIFVLSDNLRMTRTSVAKTEGYTFKLWNIQNEFQTNKDYSDSNLQIIDEYFNNNGFTEKRFGEGAPYRVIDNVALSDVRENLLDKYIFPASSKVNNNVIGKLSDLLERKQINAFVDVIWMRYGNESTHDVDDGRIGNYMVGRRPDDYKLPAVYEGDRYQFVKEDTMQLQIHIIKDKRTGSTSPALALYIPKNYIEKLTNLVIRA